MSQQSTQRDSNEDMTPRLISEINCHHDNCACDSDEVRPAVCWMPQSTDKGLNVVLIPCCATHAETWWDGADWDGRHLEMTFAQFPVMHYDTSTPIPVGTLELLLKLAQMHPEQTWGLHELGEYDQVAELVAPEVLITFGEQGDYPTSADPFADRDGVACEPAAWRLSQEAAEFLQQHNQVYVDKYPDLNGPRFLESVGR